MAGSQQPRGHRWLRWAGLYESPPPPDPEAWMPVAQNLNVDDPETGACEEAARLARALGAAGVEAQQRAYIPQNDISIGRVGLRLLGPGPPAADRIRVAVLVHSRDLVRSRELLAGLDGGD